MLENSLIFLANSFTQVYDKINSHISNTKFEIKKNNLKKLIIKEIECIKESQFAPKRHKNKDDPFLEKDKIQEDYVNDFSQINIKNIVIENNLHNLPNSTNLNSKVFDFLNNNKEFNKYIQKEKYTLTLETQLDDLMLIRDDSYLEYLFIIDNSLSQFYFKLTRNKSGVFNIEPSFDDFWSSIESLIRNNIFSCINQVNCINIFELLNPEDQAEYFNTGKDLKLNILPEYLKEEFENLIEKTKQSIQKFFLPISILLKFFNQEINNDISEILQFSKSIRNQVSDSATIINVDLFRRNIELNKKYLEIFNKYFPKDELFLGGIFLDVKEVKEDLLIRLNKNLDLVFNWTINNNIELSQKMEVEEKTITEILSVIPENVDVYEEILKYCMNFNTQLSKIWGLIQEQHQNFELLEENYYNLKHSEFNRMWKCYGIPRQLTIKKSETLSLLQSSKAIFKDQLYDDHNKTLRQISQIKNEYENKIIVDNIDDYSSTFDKYNVLQFEIENTIKECERINRHQLVVENPITDFSEIKELNKHFTNYFNLWKAVFDFENSRSEWMNEPLKKIERKKLKNTYDSVNNTIDFLERNVFRKDKQSPFKVIQDLRERIKEFQPYMPILYDLINPDLK